MTALDKYVRLEAVGLWREAPDGAAREVVVSFGKATLILTDLAEQPLGHWALAGVSVLEYGADGAAVYAMTPDGGETLTIGDRDMIAAIAAVTRRPPEPPRRRRLPIGRILALAGLAALIVAAPRLIRAATARLVPPELATEIGDRMLIALIELHGPPCVGAEGERALGLLASRLQPAEPPRLRVMRLGRPVFAPLPGGTLLIDLDLLTTATPGELTGWATAALGSDPVAAFVRDAGLLADLRYIISGRFDEYALRHAAESATFMPSAGALYTAVDLSKSDWQALRGVCG